MAVYSRLKIFSNVLRVFLWMLLCLFFPEIVRGTIASLSSYFAIMLVPICIFLGYMIIASVISIKRVYNKIVITENGLIVSAYLGLGARRYYEWKELTDARLSNESSARGPHYHSFSVFQGEKTVVRFDSLTYRNFKEMSDAITEFMSKKKEKSR